jgi:hypothetical protein
MRRALFTAVTLGALLFAVPAAGLLPLGALRPAASVVDADNHTLDLRSINGKPTLILYEDQASSQLNAAFKAELARLARGDRYRDAVALVPVADLQGYDFWPARGFVRDAIRSESKKAGTTIYCDWDGAFQRAVGFRRGTSSVVLIGRDGRVRFSAEGQLSKEERERVIALLRGEVELPSGT